MDAIVKRAQFEAWRKSKYPDQPIGPMRACGTYWRTGVQRDWEVWQKAIAALTPPEGYVLVTLKLPEKMLDALYCAEGDMSDDDMQDLWKQVLAARQEVP